ncbi:unnamed protein product [Rotaria sp. Silwood1]|nr:unnamed protein product [Rotaria sp. Silwood1]
MVLSLFVLIGWFVCIFICYYVIRPISNKLIRFFLIFFLCILLTYITCKNLPRFYVSSLIIVALCWLMSIRLISLILFSKTTLLTYQTFLLKILWIYLPILPKNKVKNQWSIIYHIILIIIKLLINHWIYRWFIKCGMEVSYERTFLFYLFIMTISYIFDIEMIIIRILTRDKYTLESFTNFPILSLSLREFWGQRYNHIINTILKESIFEPIRLEFSSSTIAALITFIISGLLHVHACFVAFDDKSILFPTFMFFFLHAIACSIETHMKIKRPEHAGWILTHAFLLITSPLMIRPFIEKGCPFIMINPPPLINIEWIPKLSLPKFCPQ